LHVRRQLRRDRIHQVAIADQHLGPRITYEEFHLGRREMPVDRAELAAGDAARVHHVDIGRRVAQQHADHVAFLHAHAAQAAGQGGTPCDEGVGVGGAVVEDEVGGHACLRLVIFFGYLRSMPD